MTPDDKYEFTIKVRMYGGTYIARCNGCTASCTSSEELAARNAAQKHFTRFCIISGFPADQFEQGVKTNSGVYVVTFTKKSTQPTP
jgi:hypothetical protein